MLSSKSDPLHSSSDGPLSELAGQAFTVFRTQASIPLSVMPFSASRQFKNSVVQGADQTPLHGMCARPSPFTALEALPPKHTFKSPLCTLDTWCSEEQGERQRPFACCLKGPSALRDRKVPQLMWDLLDNVKRYLLNGLVFLRFLLQECRGEAERGQHSWGRSRNGISVCPMRRDISCTVSESHWKGQSFQRSSSEAYFPGTAVARRRL